MSAMLLWASGYCAACASGAAEPQAPRAQQAAPSAPEQPASEGDGDEQDRLKQENCKRLRVPSGGKLGVSVTLNVPKAEDAQTEAARSALLAKLPKGDAVSARAFMNLIDLDVSDAGLAALCAEPMAKTVHPVQIYHTQ